MRQRKMRAAIAKPLRIAMRSASSASVTRRIEACVPSLWMSQRSKCSIGPAFMTISGGWMIGAGIHQRRRQRVAARLDHAGKRAADHVERMIGRRQRKHADRQPLGADGDRDLERSVFARQPWQRAGLGKADAARDCRPPAPPWQRSSSRRSPAAGTPPGRRSDAARAAARYRAARMPGQGTGSVRRR